MICFGMIGVFVMFEYGVGDVEVVEYVVKVCGEFFFEF